MNGRMIDKAKSPLLPLLRKLQLWGSFGSEEREALLSLPHSLVAYERNRHIVREGEEPTQTCVLLSGFACRNKRLGDGSRSIRSIHITGDILDLQNAFLGRADHNVQTLTPAEAALIPREAVRELAIAYPRIGMSLWYDTLVDASIFREWIANVARRDATTRLAHLLCEFGTRLEATGVGEKTRFELPLTQEQLADATGLTAVHVNRTLKEMEERGLIVRTVRDVTVSDWSRLQQAADFSDAYLHLPVPERARG